jgi:hypothetical protein
MFQADYFLSMIKQGKNPEQMMLQFLETQMRGTPMGDNLISLARQGNTAEIERIARNLVAQKGMDYDKEFKAFKQSLGL